MNLLERAVIWFAALVTGVVFLGAAVLFGLVQTYPYWPRTILGWVLFVVGFPVVFIVAEFLIALLEREPVGRWVDDRTATKAFSWIRILYLALRTVLVAVVIGAAIWLVGSRLSEVRDFVGRHFGPSL